MKKNLFVFLSILIIVAFTSLFYSNSIGINLCLFEFLIIPLMIYVNKPVRFNYLSIILLIATFLTAFMTVIIHTPWTISINILLLLTLSTALMYSGFRSYVHVFIESIIRLFTAHFPALSVHRKRRKTSSKSGQMFKKLFYYVFIPLAFLIFFLILYLSASSSFYKQVEPLVTALIQWLENFNLKIIWYIIAGFLIANIALRKVRPIGLYQHDRLSGDQLLRKRKKQYYSYLRTSTLKMQYLSAVIIFSVLNVLILYFNIIDIVYVWFFQWDGSFLKEFVHEGTWVLVFSIFLSAMMVLYFFKGNLNFYSRNKWLKRLTYLWIVQNVFMALSVIIRNYWYMHYFGLAYKRIAVFFFLMLTIIGLISVFIKINRLKSTFFLWRINAFALLLVLVFTACINWNTFIARYNFSHYNQSFIEYKFLAGLDDSALPFTLKTDTELNHIDSVQQNTMPFNTHMDYFWTGKEYQKVMQSKKTKFIKRYQTLNFLEWNVADYITYQRLKE
ncbi:MAG: DUF4153 domain-containing protein [Bacteroidales bacterium]